uniref:WW domain-containing protein n=1 Tax=Leersia perrieri TaxID=77586 RepID=A0A0D9WPI0_9ORYZ
MCTGNIVEENAVALEPTLEVGTAAATEAIPDSSGMQIVGEIGGNWKTVMHGESNQCYYWNTVTGETSWEIPNGLTSEMATDSVPSSATHVDYSVEAQAQAHTLTHNVVEAYPSDMSALNGSVAYSTFGMEQATHDAYAYAGAVTSHESMDIDPLQLARYGEDLLERLKLLERSHGSIYNVELIKREIEIRISDCNALSSYGASLLPLWLHAEVHLKQLEYSVSKMEASYSITEPRHPETADTEHKTPNEAEVMPPSSCGDLKCEVNTDTTMDGNDKTEEPLSTSVVKSEENDAAAAPSKVELDSDEDMDVEMEVDDENVEEHYHSSSMPPSKEHSPSEQVQSPTSLSLGDSAAPPPPPPEDSDIPPPPPEDEWIPPPPPENEPEPPPLPEEPAISYVSTETIPQSYVGQANLGYTVPGMEYYAAAGTDASYYMQTSESHVVQAQQNGYYAPVSASGISIPGDAASVAPVPVSYYTYPSVTMTVNGEAAEPSGYYTASVPATSSSVLDNRTSSSNLAPPTSSLHPRESDNIISKEAKMASLSQSVGATSASGTASMQGSSTQASTSTTNQSKVVRGKKRAVAVATSLRSNKKVSSLVDKWKAAKEELRDEEDEEPESALDALERKRQKDIDEWRKQQIASGEAQENANFVPLGGDWRDRVKRRRAEAKKEAKSEAIPTPAYLDESTKQVYYGNSLTSETTWDRPTK